MIVSLQSVALWIIALVVFPAAHAELVVEDPVGDVMVEPHGAGPGASVGDWEAIDLVGLEIEEAPSEFIFRLIVDEPHSDGDQRNRGYWVYFEIEGHLFDVNWDQSRDNGAVFAYLHADDDEAFPSADGQVVAYVDPDSSAYVATVPRDRFKDAEGNPPLGGTVLGNITARSRSMDDLPFTGAPAFQGNTPVYDLMGGGDQPANFTMRFGERNLTEHLNLSAAPFYFTSNGEAQNVTYAVQLTNEGSEGIVADLAVSDVPDTWNVTVEEPEVALTAGANATVRVHVSAKGGHAHGSFQDFVLSATPRAGDAASLRLGFIYHAIPQPAGHHDVLYLHARPGRDDLSHSRVFMNTLEDHRVDEDIPAVPFKDAAGGALEYTWVTCLVPNLRQPIQLKEGLGTLDVAFRSDIGADGAELRGDLVLVDTSSDPECLFGDARDDEDARVLGRLEPVGPIGLSDDPTPVTATVAPTETEPILPEPGENLVLRLFLTVPQPAADVAAEVLVDYVYLEPDGQLELPFVDVAPDVLAAHDAAIQGTQIEAPDERTQAPSDRGISGLGVAAVLAALLLLGRRS